jgi:hypothetical protein
MMRKTSLIPEKAEQRCRACIWWVGHCVYAGTMGCYWDEIGEELNYKTNEAN